MTQLIVDTTLLSHLPNLNEQVEFFSESGERLGVFLPAAQWERLMYQWAHANFDREKVERSRREGGEYSLAEILANLPRE
jgi:hypothetical protein